MSSSFIFSTHNQIDDTWSSYSVLSKDRPLQLHCRFQNFLVILYPPLSMSSTVFSFLSPFLLSIVHVSHPYNNMLHTQNFTNIFVISKFILTQNCFFLLLNALSATILALNSTSHLLILSSWIYISPHCFFNT